MKCISLWQPWATLLVYGYKIHETRSWPTNVRGPVAIHAAKKKDSEARWLSTEFPFADALDGTEFNDLPFGCLLGTVQLVDCIPTEVAYPDNWDHGRNDFYFGNFEPGRWAWKCESPTMLSDPIPYKGAQGFFEVPDELFRHVDPVLAEKWIDSPGGLR